VFTADESAHRHSTVVRIRTDEGSEWRYAAIVRAANYYEVNKSNATAFDCDGVVGLVDRLVRFWSATIAPSVSARRAR